MKNYVVTQKHRNVILFDYICPNDHEFSEMAYYEDYIFCPKCTQLAKKMIVAPNLSMRMGVDPASAQGNRWAKAHEEEAKRQNALIDPNPSS